MPKLKLPPVFVPFRNLQKEFVGFLSFFFFFIKKKIISFSHHFERNKNHLVRFFTMKRGRYNRPFLHLTTMIVLGVGVLIAPMLADTYPIFASNANSLRDLTTPQATKQSIIVGENVFQTDISQKPRDKVITYTVQKGDTLSTIAKKYGISTDTIRWENNLTSDNLAIGDSLRILPVSGIAHKVASGESVHSIAKKYDTSAQKIVDFPFNEFADPETFALVAGQILVVPDGIKPSEQPTYVRPQRYIAQGPISVTSSGFSWPLQGPISQFATWYHMALDIESPPGSAVMAAQSGKVTYISTGTWDYGYGNNVWVEDANGQATHYAHMSCVSVGIGQTVTVGKSQIGCVGMTGRTTGPHLHFEIRQNGSLVNPLAYLQ